MPGESSERIDLSKVAVVPIDPRSIPRTRSGTMDADSEQQLHGAWDEHRRRRWCQDCGEWVHPGEWEEHKRPLAKQGDKRW